MSVGYAAMAAEIAALPRRDTRRADLIRLSDRLLEALEELNLAAYPVPPHQPEDSGRKVVLLPVDAAEAVNGLLVEVNLQPRPYRVWTTADGLDAIYAAQRCLFGQPDDEDAAEDEP